MQTMNFEDIHVNENTYLYKSAGITIIPAICFINILSDDSTICEQIMYLFRDMSNKIKDDVI